MRPLNVLAPIAAAALTTGALAELTIAPVFSSGMVLQREQTIIVWGTADPGELVSIDLADLSVEAAADRRGNFELRLPAIAEPGGPHTLTLRSPDDAPVRLDNIMIGDVWIASGQSNMDWPLDRTDRGDRFIPQASIENLRLLRIDRRWNLDEQHSAHTTGWSVSDPDHAASFSAVGWHFGRLMNEHTGVPVGIIQSAWGGTPAEAWTPMREITARPDELAGVIEMVRRYDLPEAEARRLEQRANAAYTTFVRDSLTRDNALSENWHRPDFDDSAWQTLRLPGWIEQELGNFDGIVWFRRTITLSSEQAEAGARLHLGRIDDYDTVYINATNVGSTQFDVPNAHTVERIYDVPASVLREGENTIAIQLMDTIGSGGVNPRENEFLLRTASGDVSLAGDWRFAPSFDGTGRFPRQARHAVPSARPERRAAVLYNAMINPLDRLGIRGVIWYQGESNAGRGFEYRTLFPAMIDGWRHEWRDAREEPDFNFPFLFVQLPILYPKATQPTESQWAEVRDAQRRTLDLTEHTAMAITLDVGDPGDIHPTNKLPVAERLASLARAMLESPDDHPRASGPIPVETYAREDHIRINFDARGPLQTTDGEPPRSFEIAGEDGRFRTVQATIARNSVLLDVGEPERVFTLRYAWADNPDVNLTDAIGMPVSTFEIHLVSPSRGEPEH